MFLSLGVFWELTKPRLSLLSVITALVGYLIAQNNHGLIPFMILTIGASFAAGGCAVLNHYMEASSDALMPRTQSRPLPLGKIDKRTVLLYGIALCLAGNLTLWIGINPLAASIVALTQLFYLLVYTPLKRISPWNTEVGAVAGALPPLVGYAAAEQQSWQLGWILFAILFAWQIPHFMALSWMYRQDYAKGRFKMLSVTEPTGHAVSRKTFVYTAILVGCSLAPFFLRETTFFYGIVATGLGIIFLRSAFLFCKKEKRDQTARPLFFISIIYLPILLAVLVIDRWIFFIS